MNNYYNVVVLLLTDNCADALDRSIDSVLNQSFDAKRIKIVAVDNHSTDGTYEKLLKYACSTGISVYRLKKKSFPTRLLRSALSYLTYTDHKYITVLCPGDILYENYITRCAEVMDEYCTPDRRLLICEADIAVEKDIIDSQTPIYTSNCILLKREHYKEFFINGVGHKVQVFFLNNTIPTMLPELPSCVDYTDWFSKAMYSFGNECIYLQDILACTKTFNCQNKIYDLILRLYTVTRLDLIRGTVFSDISLSYLDSHDVAGKINNNLSLLALKYASEAVDDGDMSLAERILLFAEMVDEEVTGTENYCMVKKSIASGCRNQFSYTIDISENSVSPPEGAIII